MEIDYRNPDYTPIFAARARLLKKIRSDPALLTALKVHYATNPWDFVSDWGMTFDPRNIEKDLIPSMPFVLWEKQRDYLHWLYDKWRSGERGLAEKSRDCGVTWLSVGFAVSMWCFVPGFTTGFGSRKEELVDKRGDSKSIFEKVRFFIENIPIEFMPPSYDPRTCSAHMRIVNPDTEAAIIGECGDEIGRGGRTSIYLVDEAAFIEHQDKVDAALSQNTNCQVDISTPNGNGNAFYKKRQRFNGTSRIFIFDWRDDPRKDDAWYAKQQAEQDEVVVAQEIDRDYNASSEDAFIPAKWVSACIDAHKVLGFSPVGIRASFFDPADVGDAKAMVNRYGSVVMEAKQKKKGDITDAIPWAFDTADSFRADVLGYDGDGMGSPTMKLALQHRAAGRMRIEAYHGSGEKFEGEAKYGGGDPKDDQLKTNDDTFVNYRAQTWTWLRDRCHNTYDAVNLAKSGKMINVDPETLFSISTECEDWADLQAELSRPKRIFTPNGKIKVEAKEAMRARGVDSPNLGDACVGAMSLRVPDGSKKPKPKFKHGRIRDRMVGM